MKFVEGDTEPFSITSSTRIGAAWHTTEVPNRSSVPAKNSWEILVHCLVLWVDQWKDQPLAISLHQNKKCVLKCDLIAFMLYYRTVMTKILIRMLDKCYPIYQRDVDPF